MKEKEMIKAIYDAVAKPVSFKIDPIVCANPELFNRFNTKSETDTAIETIRTKTSEIEAAQKAIDEAKALLASKGVEYVGAKSEPDEDMSDWRNWKVGDLVLCKVSNAGGHRNIFKAGKTYKVSQVDIADDDVPIAIDGYWFSESDTKTDISWHSRPTS